MSLQDQLEPEWAWTPDVLLFIAAAVMSLAVIGFSIWLFLKAAREEKTGGKSTR